MRKGIIMADGGEGEGSAAEAPPPPPPPPPQIAEAPSCTFLAPGIAPAHATSAPSPYANSAPSASSAANAIAAGVNAGLDGLAPSAAVFGGDGFERTEGFTAKQAKEAARERMAAKRQANSKNRRTPLPKAKDEKEKEEEEGTVKVAERGSEVRTYGEILQGRHGFVPPHMEGVARQKSRQSSRGDGAISPPIRSKSEDGGGGGRWSIGAWLLR